MKSWPVSQVWHCFGIVHLYISGGRGNKSGRNSTVPESGELVLWGHRETLPDILKLPRIQFRQLDLSADLDRFEVSTHYYSAYAGVV